MKKRRIVLFHFLKYAFNSQINSLLRLKKNMLVRDEENNRDNTENNS